MHTQPSSGARCLIFGRTLRLLPYFMCTNSEGSGKTARMRKFTRAFAGRLCDKYQNPMSWLIFTLFRGEVPIDGPGEDRPDHERTSAESLTSSDKDGRVPAVASLENFGNPSETCWFSAKL